MKYMYLLLFALLVCGCLSEPSGDVELDFELVANQNSLLVPVSMHSAAVRSDYDGADPEWIDSWTSDGCWVWYTPEDYDFYEGDTIDFVVYYMPGDYWNLVRIDAFYRCGSTDWRNYLMTASTDFGTLPPPPPGYGWITGVGYITPGASGSFDWASRCDLDGYNLPAGVPLFLRPDCFYMN